MASNTNDPSDEHRQALKKTLEGFSQKSLKKIDRVEPEIKKAARAPSEQTFIASIKASIEHDLITPQQLAEVLTDATHPAHHTNAAWLTQEQEGWLVKIDSVKEAVKIKTDSLAAFQEAINENGTTEDKLASLAKAEASNENLEKILNHANGKQPKVLSAIAGNNAAKAEHLEIIAAQNNTNDNEIIQRPHFKDVKKETLATIAARTADAGHLTAILVATHGKKPEVLAAVAGNDNANAKALKTVVDNDGGANDALVVTRTHVDKAELVTIAGRTTVDTVLNVALAKSTDPTVLAAVAGNDNADAKALKTVVDNDGGANDALVVTRTHVDKAELVTIAGRTAVATVLNDALAKSKDITVLTAVAGNDNADAQALKTVVDNDGGANDALVVTRTHVDKAELVTIAGRTAVATVLNDALAKSKDITVLTAVAGNDNADAQALKTVVDNDGGANDAVVVTRTHVDKLELVTIAGRTTVDTVLNAALAKSTDITVLDAIETKVLTTPALHTVDTLVNNPDLQQHLLKKMAIKATAGLDTEQEQLLTANDNLAAAAASKVLSDLSLTGSSLAGHGAVDKKIKEIQAVDTLINAAIAATTPNTFESVITTAINSDSTLASKLAAAAIDSNIATRCVGIDIKLLAAIPAVQTEIINAIKSKGTVSIEEEIILKGNPTILDAVVQQAYTNMYANNHDLLKSKSVQEKIVSQILLVDSSATKIQARQDTVLTQNADIRNEVINKVLAATNPTPRYQNILDNAQVQKDMAPQIFNKSPITPTAESILTASKPILDLVVTEVVKDNTKIPLIEKSPVIQKGIAAYIISNNAIKQPVEEEILEKNQKICNMVAAEALKTPIKTGLLASKTIRNMLLTDIIDNAKNKKLSALQIDLLAQLTNATSADLVKDAATQALKNKDASFLAENKDIRKNIVTQLVGATASLTSEEKQLLMKNADLVAESAAAATAAATSANKATYLVKHPLVVATLVTEMVKATGTKGGSLSTEQKALLSETANTELLAAAAKKALEHKQTHPDLANNPHIKTHIIGEIVKATSPLTAEQMLCLKDPGFYDEIVKEEAKAVSANTSLLLKNPEFHSVLVAHMTMTNTRPVTTEEATLLAANADLAAAAAKVAQPGSPLATNLSVQAAKAFQTKLDTIKTSSATELTSTVTITSTSDPEGLKILTAVINADNVQESHLIEIAKKVTDPTILIAITNTSKVKVIDKVLQEILNNSVAKADKTVLTAVANKANEDTIKLLVKNNTAMTDQDVLVAIANNPNVESSIVPILTVLSTSNTPNENFLRALAGNKKLSPNQLNEILKAAANKSPIDTIILKALAGNTAAEESTLAGVLSIVRKNIESSPQKIDSILSILTTLAGNESSTAVILENVLKDTLKIRKNDKKADILPILTALAGNLHTNEETLKKIMNTDEVNIDILDKIIAHPNGEELVQAATLRKSQIKSNKASRAGGVGPASNASNSANPVTFSSTNLSSGVNGPTNLSAGVSNSDPSETSKTNLDAIQRALDNSIDAYHDAHKAFFHTEARLQTKIHDSDKDPSKHFVEVKHNPKLASSERMFVAKPDATRPNMMSVDFHDHDTKTPKPVTERDAEILMGAAEKPIEIRSTNANDIVILLIAANKAGKLQDIKLIGDTGRSLVSNKTALDTLSNATPKFTNEQLNDLMKPDGQTNKKSPDAVEKKGWFHRK